MDSGPTCRAGESGSIPALSKWFVLNISGLRWEGMVSGTIKFAQPSASPQKINTRKRTYQPSTTWCKCKCKVQREKKSKYFAPKLKILINFLRTCVSAKSGRKKFKVLATFLFIVCLFIQRDILNKLSCSMSQVTTSNKQAINLHSVASTNHLSSSRRCHYGDLFRV